MVVGMPLGLGVMHMAVKDDCKLMNRKTVQKTMVDNP